MVVIEGARVLVWVLLTCLRRDLVVIEVARVWIRGTANLSETRSGCNRSCPEFGSAYWSLG